MKHLLAAIIAWIKMCDTISNRHAQGVEADNRLKKDSIHDFYIHGLSQSVIGITSSLTLRWQNSYIPKILTKNRQDKIIYFKSFKLS